MIKKFDEHIREGSVNFPKTKEDTISVCKKLGLSDFLLNSDLTVDVSGSVWLTNQNLECFPIKFSHVGGVWFDCSGNNLKSLEGSPLYIEGEFDCSNNWLSSLEGGPEYVKSDYKCSANNLSSLKGCPGYIEGDFDASSNNLHTFEHGPKEVDGRVYFYSNPIVEITNLFGFFGYDMKINKKILELWDDYKPVSYENGIWYFNEKIFKRMYREVTDNEFVGTVQAKFNYFGGMKNYTLISDEENSWEI